MSNLRQLTLAAEMYWDENEQRSFRYLAESTNGGTIYWFGWIKPGPEGEREFDATYGALYPFLEARGVEICPSLNYGDTIYKLKAQGAAYGYGYNRNLSGVSMQLVRRPSDTALFADSAQVNDFQLPATPEHPMLEEFYYIDDLAQTVHFRHNKQANTSFCDGHIGRERPAAGSLDERLAGEVIGRLRTELVIP